MILIAIGNCNIDALFEQRFQNGNFSYSAISFVWNVIVHKEEYSIIKCLLSERQDKLMIFNSFNNSQNSDWYHSNFQKWLQGCNQQNLDCRKNIKNKIISFSTNKLKEVKKKTEHE